MVTELPILSRAVSFILLVFGVIYLSRNQIHDFRVLSRLVDYTELAKVL